MEVIRGNHLSLPIHSLLIACIHPLRISSVSNSLLIVADDNVIIVHVSFQEIRSRHFRVNYRTRRDVCVTMAVASRSSFQTTRAWAIYDSFDSGLRANNVRKRRSARNSRLINAIASALCRAIPDIKDITCMTKNAQ